MSQNAINYLEYNITLPEFLDNKEAIIGTHIMLGNGAALLFPTENIANALIASNIGSFGYTVKLITMDSLKAHQLTDKPIEVAIQCGVAILTYNLPGIATSAAVNLLMPGISYGVTYSYIITSTSLGAIHCSNNYQYSKIEATISDTTIPLIIDTAVLFLISGNLQLGVGSFGMLMVSISNCINVATTVYASDSVTRMLMDMIPQDIKKEYIDPIFNYARESILEIMGESADL